MLKKNILIKESDTVKDALKKLDNTAEKVLLVVEDDTGILLGTLTDGDIRRYILKGKSLEGPIRGVYNKTPHYLTKNNFTVEKAKNMLISNKIELIPILDEDTRPVDYFTWNQILPEKKDNVVCSGNIEVPVVIMAGGKGCRLEPFTKVFPKPLIPIGDKTMIERIIDEFKTQGVKKYYITLNTKGEMIEAYFNSIEKDYRVEFIYDIGKPLGTAGSLRLLKKKIGNIFIMSNCDVIVKANFKEVLEFHKKQKVCLTVLSSIQHYRIPYGIIKFKKGGNITNIDEKPEYTFPINTGVYVISKDALRHIPSGSSFDMTDFIKALIKKNKGVAMYPVNENDYIDIGQWEEYKKSVEKLRLLA